MGGENGEYSHEKGCVDEIPDNLIDVAWKSDELVIECLERRVRAGNFYTWAGTTLVAVNPCRPVPELYEDAVRHQYYQGDLSEARGRAPHAWAAAARAREQVRRGAGDQLLVVSGDSGAGKTYTAWLMLDLLASCGASGGGGDGDDVGGGGGAASLRLLRDAGPLLSAMGHARTALNAHSSRFGTLITLRLAPAYAGRGHWRAIGTRVHTFLLEKARAASPAHGERNFHIFYQMLEGLDEDERERLRLPLGKAFRAAPFFDADADPDAEASERRGLADAFVETRRCIQSLSSEEEAAALLRLLAALLHLGEVKFAQPKDTEAEGDGDGCCGGVCTVDRLTPGSWEALEAAAGLLGVEAATLEQLLTSALVSVGASGSATPRHTVYRRLVPSAADCAARRDCLVRFLYERAFRWAVSRANASLRQQEDQTHEEGADVGVLDLFGFECLPHNSLEQLCINYASERLQLSLLRAQGERAREAQEADMEEEPEVVEAAEAAAREEVEAAVQRVRLLDGHISVFSVIDQEAVLQRRALSAGTAARTDADAGALAAALHEALRERPSFLAERSTASAAAATRFAVRHFAGDVSYDTRAMLDKNMDRAPAEFAEVLATGSDERVAAIVAAEDPSSLPQCPSSTPSTPRTRPTLTLLSKFKAEVDALVARLEAAETHHVRCVKASTERAPGVVDAAVLRRQLAAAGLLEALRHAQQRYPVRMRIEDFERRFGSLPATPLPSTDLVASGGDKDLEPTEEKGKGEAAGAVTPNLSKEAVRVGRRSVYLTEAAAAALEAERLRRRAAAASVLQRAWRRMRLRAPACPSPSSPPLSPPPLRAPTPTPRTKQVVYRGDRIVSRRPLAKAPIWFHTRVTCLPFSHVLPFWELPQGLLDLI